MRDCQARAASLTALQQRPMVLRRWMPGPPSCARGATHAGLGQLALIYIAAFVTDTGPDGAHGPEVAPRMRSTKIRRRGRIRRQRRRRKWGQTRRRYPPAHLVQRPGRDPGIPVSSKIGQPRSRVAGVAFRHVDNEFPSETTSRRNDISLNRRCTMTGFAQRTQSMRPIPRAAVFWKHANGICARRGQQAAAMELVAMPAQ